jgi:tetratricopeptide (TPR) repeat protein
MTQIMPGPHLQRDLIRWGHYEALDRELLSDLHNTSLSIRREARWLLLFSLLNQGRRRDAAALAHMGRLPDSGERVAGLIPEPLEIALVALLSDRWGEAARGFREQADQTRAAQAPPGLRARVGAWMLALAASAHAEAGDTSAVRGLADTVRMLGQESSFGRDPKLYHVLRGLLLQRAGRHAEAVDAFGQGVFSTTDGYTRTNLMAARSLLTLGRAADAIAILQPALRGGVDGSNSYVSRTELHETLARAFEAAGRPDSAADHYRAVERAWRRADPELRARYLRAKALAGKGPWPGLDSAVIRE